VPRKLDGEGRGIEVTTLVRKCSPSDLTKDGVEYQSVAVPLELSRVGS